MGRNSSAVFLPLKLRKKLNAPPANQPWGWFSFELLESAAMRSLSVNGRRVLDRIRLEHMAHAGLENGRLKVNVGRFCQVRSREAIYPRRARRGYRGRHCRNHTAGPKGMGKRPGCPDPIQADVPSSRGTRRLPAAHKRMEELQRSNGPQGPATAKIKPSIKRGLDRHENFFARSPMVT
jgi:hypothetical protein